MFGVFGKTKYLKNVYKKIDILIDQAGCPRTTKTLEGIKEELRSNGGSTWDEKNDWHSIIAEQIQQVAWAHRDYLYQEAELEENQAAVFCISEFISHKANNGDFRDLDLSNQMDLDLYDSCKKLWSLCGAFATAPISEKKFAHVVRVPIDGNPFEE
ncbi:hypothetical protein OA067_04250 [Gammaproteobacteria bacterium]|nr:hypothetical protein [Gammaproteobacteria bacterium]